MIDFFDKKIIDSAQINQSVLDLINNSSTVFFILDAGSLIQYISGSVERFTGYRPEQMRGRALYDFIASADVEKFRSLLRDSLNKIASTEISFLSPTGGPVPGSVSVITQYEIAAKFVMGLFEPPEKKHSSDEMYRKLLMAVEQSPASVIITDMNGHIEYVNPKFTGLTGYTFDEVRGKNPRILKSGEQSKDFYRELWDTISSGREWRGEFHNRKKNGELYWEFASISPVVNAGGVATNYIAVKEDITQRKAAEEGLKKSEENLRRKNEEMNRELHYAGSVIRNFIPESPPGSDLVAVEFLYIPLNTVGGDFFSFVNLDHDDLGVFVGDVSGHGVSAALFLSQVNFVMTNVQADFFSRPSVLLTELNGQLCDNMFSYFLTALYCLFKRSGNGVDMVFSRGGHTPPLIHDRGNNSVELLHSDGKPLGIFEDIKFSDNTKSLKPGDRVYLYTDGLYELTNEENEMLDFEGLMKIIEGTAALSLKESLISIMHEIDRYRGQKNIDDDIVLIGFEVK